MITLNSLALVLALAAASSAAHAASLPPSSQQRGPQVASIDVMAPQAESFVLHATIPLPKGELAPGAKEIPFGVISHDPARSVVPAQVQGVSRYPDGDWDVVQVIARVERGEEEQPGGLLSYEVVRAPHALAPAHQPSRLLAGLLARKRGIVLRCRDVYGHSYSFDLLALPKGPGTPKWRMRKNGSFLNQFRTSGALLPDRDEHSAKRAGPALPHMLGVMAWFSDWQGEESLQLDLRLHNGLTSGARPAELGEEPVGAIYWQSVELMLPGKLALVPNVKDPFFGEPYADGSWRVYPIVKPYDDGQLHMMPPQAQFLRRLVIVREGDEALARARLDHEGLGFCAHSTEDWSWSNPRTARYFPQRDELPSMDFYGWQRARGKGALRAHEARKLSDRRALLVSGRGGPYPSKSPVLGWAHPYFISIQGGTGGEEVALLAGQRAVGGVSRESYALLEITHRMNLSRQPQAMWNAKGQPMGVDDWQMELRGVPTIPFDYRTHSRATVPPFRLPARGGPASNTQVDVVAKRDARPPYDGGTPFVKGGALPQGDQNIVNWMPHDGEHLIRLTKNAKAMLWLGDDPSSEDDLELCAELFRLSFHELASPHKDGALVTLAHHEAEAQRHPHEGLPVSRETAWGLDAFCAYYSTAPDKWRARHRPWAERVADLFLAGAMPSGLLIRSAYPPLLGNPRYVGAHAFQSQFLLLAQRSLIESVFRDVDRERSSRLASLYLRSVDYLFWGPVWQRRKTAWSPADAPVFETGPRWAFPVALNNDHELPPFSNVEYWGAGYIPKDGFKGDVETTYGFSSLSFAADWTSPKHGTGLKNKYIKRALEYGRGAENFDALYQRITSRADQPAFDATKDAAGFLSRLQRWRKKAR